jgi:serine protease Do
VSSADLPAYIGQASPGEKVTLELARQGKRETLSAQLGDAGAKKAEVAQADKAASQGRLGLALRPLQPQEKREAGVDGGLVIEDVAGASARAGVQPGDLLVAVNGTPVTSVDQVRAAVAKAEKSVALLIQRDGDRIFVPVKLG